MLRHLKNLNELVLYASISCGIAFLSRSFPAFFFPILLLRLGVLVYCLYVIARIEKNREFAFILGGALSIGAIGGTWDYIEVYAKYNQEIIAKFLTIATCLILGCSGLAIYLGDFKNGKYTTKK